MKIEMRMVVLCCVLGAIGGCAARQVHPAKELPMPSESVATGFINKTVIVDGNERAYVAYVPRGYTPAKEWPLILFLHGAGERGDDGLFQTDVGIGRAIRHYPDRFPCLVVMPQCPHDVWWDKVVAEIDAALAKTRVEYAVDPARIYLTGLSMGGFATWLYGARHTDLFAALMPICGGGRIEDAPELAKIPIWAFHGADDPTVPVQRSREMVEAVKKAHGKIDYTEYPGVGHRSWEPAYDDPDVIKWLLKQHKKH